MAAIRKEVLSSLVLLLLGAGYLAYSITYPVDTLNNPGPAVFPLIAGGVLIILTLSQLIQSLKQSRKQAPSKDSPSSPEDAIKIKPFLLILAFVAYLLTMKWTGFFTANTLFVVISSRLMGARDWGRPVLLAAGVGLFCYLLFVVWLKLSLPRGF
jgi:hypothetical protein